MTDTSSAPIDLGPSYQEALRERARRQAAGDTPRGYKVGFTNRAAWPRLGVVAPMWGTVWETTLSVCEGSGMVLLDGMAQPRIEAEAVVGFHATPPEDASVEQLFECIEWLAPGFEIVAAPDAAYTFDLRRAIALAGLHAHLLVGARVPVRGLAPTGAALDARLAAARVELRKGSEVIESNTGALVLGGPLLALQAFQALLRDCPGAPRIQAGDVITTGAWGGAWNVSAGEEWTAVFDAPLSTLSVRFA